MIGLFDTRTCITGIELPDKVLDFTNPIIVNLYLAHHWRIQGHKLLPAEL